MGLTHHVPDGALLDFAGKLDATKPFHRMTAWALLIVFGLLVRVLLWPLNQKAMRANMKMQEVQPLMKDIQERHKEDPQRMQQEMFKLYKEHGVNPLGGCLPEEPVRLAHEEARRRRRAEADRKADHVHVGTADQLGERVDDQPAHDEDDARAGRLSAQDIQVRRGDVRARQQHRVDPGAGLVEVAGETAAATRTVDHLDTARLQRWRVIRVEP